MVFYSPNAAGERRPILTDISDNRKKPAGWAVRSGAKLG